MSVALTQSFAATEARRSVPEQQALWFTGAIFAVSLALQRFGLPFGGKALSIVGPIGIALVAYGLFKGALSFHKGRLLTFLALTALILCGMALHSAEPGGFGEGASVDSLLQFLLLTSFAVFTFSEPVEEAAFFRVVTFALMVIACAGVLQFIAQFFGLGLFSFTGILPDSLLFEAGYNLEIPLGIGDILKSNGFLLVEPSVLSQLMALGIIIEASGARRPPFLVAFVAGLLLSFSGTGWIVLGAFVAGSAIAMGKRGLIIALGVVVALSATLALAAVLTPDVMDMLTSRLSEISQPGTSGHMRFVTPFWMLSDVLASHKSAFLLGIGSGGSERLVLPYVYDVNTPIKVMVDYGFPALICYVALFLLGRKTPIQAAVVAPAIVLFFFAGGYQQFPPMVFIVLLLTSVARLRVTPQSAASAINRPAAATRGAPARL